MTSLKLRDSKKAYWVMIKKIVQASRTILILSLITFIGILFVPLSHRRDRYWYECS